MTPVLSSAALLARMVDGRSMIITMFAPIAQSYTLERAVIGTAGLMSKTGFNVRLIELLECDGERSDVMLAAVGVTKPRPRLLKVLCCVCGSLLSGPNSYKKHRVLHESDVIVCGGCSCAFKDRFYYKLHRVKCYKICPFKMSDVACKFKAKTNEVIVKHMEKNHRFDRQT